MSNYKKIILAMILGSLLGISIEYLINRDFQSSGFFITLGVTGTFLLRERRRNKSK